MNDDAPGSDNETRVEQLLLAAAQDYLACKGVPVALVTLPGHHPPLFMLMGTSDQLPAMLEAAGRQSKLQR
jgi:hypothetical protein